MNPERPFWEELFGASAAGPYDEKLECRLLRKGGRPFLLLPRSRWLAPAVLDLYPAQTAKARIAKLFLFQALRFGLFPGTEPVSIHLRRDDPFLQFLGSVSGRGGGAIPYFGILAGNPAADTQRFLVMVFSSQPSPVGVVKAGVSQRAQALVRKEAAFLEQVPQDLQGIPALRGKFEDLRCQALALSFVEGRAPRPVEAAALLSGVLPRWISRRAPLPLGEISDWKRLETAAAGQPLFLALAKSLKQHTVVPVLQHGDFAPWNIKVSAKAGVTVLDWERGELEGIPAWDWFHYSVQVGILVEHKNPIEMVACVETMLADRAFQEYAQRARIQGIERPLLLAYLLHSAEVIRPAEGLRETRALLEALAERWNVGR
jgi:hypothetical protein